MLSIIAIIAIILIICFVGWLESVGSRIVYKLDHRQPILYVVPIQSILGKLAVVPISDTGTIQHLHNVLPSAPGDSRTGAWMQYVARQQVGIGMVTGYVMNGEGFERAVSHGEKFMSTPSLCCITMFGACYLKPLFF